MPFILISNFGNVFVYHEAAVSNYIFLYIIMGNRSNQLQNQILLSVGKRVGNFVHTALLQCRPTHQYYQKRGSIYHSQCIQLRPSVSSFKRNFNLMRANEKWRPRYTLLPALHLKKQRDHGPRAPSRSYAYTPIQGQSRET